MQVLDRKDLRGFTRRGVPDALNRESPRFLALQDLFQGHKCYGPTARMSDPRHGIREICGCGGGLLPADVEPEDQYQT